MAGKTMNMKQLVEYATSATSKKGNAYPHSTRKNNTQPTAPATGQKAATVRRSIANLDIRSKETDKKIAENQKFLDANQEKIDKRRGTPTADKRHQKIFYGAR